MVKALFRTKMQRYVKLPHHHHLLRLSILKLDGSCFGIQVARNAMVAQLISAIEDEYRHSSEDGGDNLWSVVWSYFCLCHKGQKLLNEKVGIHRYNIEDGDQLYFVQHLRTKHGRVCSRYIYKD